jgi:hypothetical protein
MSSQLPRSEQSSSAQLSPQTLDKLSAYETVNFMFDRAADVMQLPMLNELSSNARSENCRWNCPLKWIRRVARL